VNPNKRIMALLTLLQDDDPRIASLAMEQFLSLGPLAEQAIAEHQESQDPQLRCRMHQLSTILSRRRARVGFIASMSADDTSLWDGLLQLNELYDPRRHRQSMTAELTKVFGDLHAQPGTTPRLAVLMRDNEFTVPDEDILDVDLYLVARVLQTRYGSPALLCALAQHVAAQLNWSLTIVLQLGRFKLIDRNNLLLDPTEGWRISRLKAEDGVHPCSRRDVLFCVLSHLFLASLVDGQLRDLYHFGDLLTALNGTDLRDLPKPLGDLAD